MNLAKCKDCIHEKICLHRVHIQTDTYAYMGVKYDTEKCEHFIPTTNENKQGEWVRCGYSLTGEKAYKCSLCGFAVANIEDVEMRYCPGCGAKMKGENNDLDV